MYTDHTISGLVPSVFHPLDKGLKWTGELTPLVNTAEVVLYSKRMKYRSTTPVVEQATAPVVEQAPLEDKVIVGASTVMFTLPAPSVECVESHKFEVGDFVEVLPGAVDACRCALIEGGIYRVCVVDDSDGTCQLGAEDTPTWVAKHYLRSITLTKGTRVKVVNPHFLQFEDWQKECVIDRIDLDDLHYPFFATPISVRCSGRWFKVGDIGLA